MFTLLFSVFRIFGGRVGAKTIQQLKQLRKIFATFVISQSKMNDFIEKSFYLFILFFLVVWIVGKIDLFHFPSLGLLVGNLEISTYTTFIEWYGFDFELILRIYAPQSTCGDGIYSIFETENILCQTHSTTSINLVRVHYF